MNPSGHIGDREMRRVTRTRNKFAPVNFGVMKSSLPGVLAFFVTLAVSAANVQEMPSPAGPGAGEPFLAADANGRLMMSWLEPVGSTGTFALRFARFDGQWSKPQTIVEGNDFFINWADFPSIVGDTKGNLVAHWLQKSGPSTYAYDVRYAVSRDGGRSWSRSMLLNRDARKVEHGFASFAARPEGGFAAVWLDGRQMPENTEEGEMSLRYAEMRPDGNTIRELILDKRTCECCTTAMTRTGDGFVVAYRDRSEKEIRDIAVARVTTSKVMPPSRLHDDGWEITGCPVNGPQIDARGNRVAIAWFTGAKNHSVVNVAFSADGGRVFGKPIRVDSGSPMGRVDVLLLPDNDALVVWMEGMGNAAQVSARRVSASGRLGQVVNLADSSSARSSGFPRAALIGTKAYFAWTGPGTPKRVHVAGADVGGF